MYAAELSAWVRSSQAALCALLGVCPSPWRPGQRRHGAGDPDTHKASGFFLAPASAFFIPPDQAMVHLLSFCPCRFHSSAIESSSASEANGMYATQRAKKLTVISVLH
ncbi:hypothetical protein EDB82DRAFT_484323 [Fusarium venenatum]|uniref:uncharacterized protein n=1 Tax=Fusarium venenatum TaxID=56646 RepID=UPI001DD3384E|nr:hypothetical protein EDB82DRAFT_484323 [Fusarium venenatum]